MQREGAAAPALCVTPLNYTASLLSRPGMLKHCRHTRFYAAYIPDHLQRRLKDIVRQRARKEREKWIRNTSLAMTATP